MFRKRFGCFLHDFGNKVVSFFIADVSGLCRPWKTAFGWLSGLGCLAFSLESVVPRCGKWSWAEIRGTVTQSMEPNLGRNF